VAEPEAALVLTVLGCSGSYPGPGSACSGYLVEGGGTRLWLDAGSGTLANLLELADLASIDAVVISHRHVDHWTDLEHAAVALRYFVQRAPLPVYAPAELPGLLRVGDAADRLAWQVVGDGAEAKVGSLRLVFSQTDHPVETLACRVSHDGAALAYSSDTGPGWALSALGKGPGLALVEASFLADLEDRHLPHQSARQAAFSAAKAGAGRLVLTHLWPSTDPERALAEASRHFEGPVELARAMRRYPIWA